MRTIETEDLRELLKRNENSEQAPRDLLALLGAALWGVTATELSKIAVGDILKTNGEIRRKWTLPASAAHNGQDRTLTNEHPRLLATLDHYIEWRRENGWGTVKSARYRGLDPKTPLLLNDRAEAFGFTRRSKDDPHNPQPSGMNALFRRLIGRTKYAGQLSFKDFRHSFIQHLARPDEGGLSIRNIMEVTGMRDYESVRRIVALDTKRVSKAVNGIYNRL